MNVVETKVRLTPASRERVEALVGPNRLSSFIREAIENELLRREQAAALDNGTIQQIAVVLAPGEGNEEFIRVAIAQEIRRRVRRHKKASPAAARSASEQAHTPGKTG